MLKSVGYLFTEWPQVDGEGEAVASCLLVTLTFGKIKAESQQRDGHEWREFSQLGRLSNIK